MLSLLVAVALAAPPPPAAGEDVEVRVATAGTVVSLAADVIVAAPITGDVVAVAGNIVLLAGGRVSGDAVALGGRVVGEGEVGGRAVSLAGLGLFDTSDSPVLEQSRKGWGLRIAWLGGWLLIGNLLLLLVPRTVRRTGRELVSTPLRTAAVGVGLVLFSLALLVVGLALSRSLVGVFLLVAVLLALLAAKLVGVVGMAWVVGEWLQPRLPLSLRSEIVRTAAGLTLLCVLASAPWFGAGFWALANVGALGAAATLILRRQPVVSAVPLSGVR